MRSIKRFFFYLFNDPKKLLVVILYRCARLFPDRMYLKMMFPLRVGYPLNIDHPKTYNEKIQWLKLHYRRPQFTDMVDKLAAKKYVADIIGDEHIIPTLGIYDSVEEINWQELPSQFVLKCTHDSGGVVICPDKSKLDISLAKSKLSKGLKQTFYYQGREWPYKNVPHRIILEKYMVDESGLELKDYKFFCFDGEPKFLFVATDRMKSGEEVKFDFYDMEFKHLSVKNGHPNAAKSIAKPLGFEAMVEIASKLSKGLPHVRVDLYDINGSIYFGELTFYHFSGFTPFVPIEWDYKFGKMIRLPEKYVND